MQRLFSNPYFSLLRTAWRYARDQRRRYLLVYGMFTVSVLVVSLRPIIWGLYINELQRDGMQALRVTWLYAGAYLLITFVDWVFHGLARVMERKLAFDLSRNFLQELYHKALHLPVKWHQDHHSGSTINRIRKAYEALKEFFDNGFMYFHSIVKFVIALGAIIFFSPLFGLVAVSLGIGVVAVILRFDRPFIAASREVNEREHVVSSTLFDTLSNIITVITLRLERRMESGLLSRVSDIFPPFRRKVLVNEWKWFTVEMLITLIYGIIVVGYVYQNWVPGEVFLVGGLVTLVGYVNQFTGVFSNIAWQYTRVVGYHTDISTAENVIDAYDRQHLPDAGCRLPTAWKRLEVRHLSFTHNEVREEGEPVQGLNSIRIQMERGKRIAFIGESGSGKSTLLALLRGLYQPEPEVEVTIDGQTRPGFSAIANHVTLFPQEPEIFENTIEYNITLGLPFSEAEVRHVCDTARFSEVVAQLPAGLQSSIREKGVNLSGGQKQRLALARGILAARDSDIVLLDEPTSSVDPKTELEIYERLFREFAGKAVVSSLHRLHLLVHFDYVYVLDQGRLVDEGTFEHLRKHSAVFQELWRHQEDRSSVLVTRSS